MLHFEKFYWQRLEYIKTFKSIPFFVETHLRPIALSTICKNLAVSAWLLSSTWSQMLGLRYPIQDNWTHYWTQEARFGINSIPQTPCKYIRYFNLKNQKYICYLQALSVQKDLFEFISMRSQDTLLYWAAYKRALLLRSGILLWGQLGLSFGFNRQCLHFVSSMPPVEDVDILCSWCHL